MSRHSSGPSAAAAEAKGSNQGAACLPCSSAVILQPFLCRGRLVILSWCSIRDQCLGDAGPRWVENLRDAEVQLGQLHHKVVQHYVRSVNNVLLPRYRPPPPAHSHLLSLWPARPACMSQSSPRHLHSHGPLNVVTQHPHIEFLLTPIFKVFSPPVSVLVLAWGSRSGSNAW